jgi:hypothetical protein
MFYLRDKAEREAWLKREIGRCDKKMEAASDK